MKWIQEDRKKSRASVGYGTNWSLIIYIYTHSLIIYTHIHMCVCIHIYNIVTYNWKSGVGGLTWTNNIKKFSKFDENYKPADPRNSTNTEHKKDEEN